MASKEYIGLARLTEVFGYLKNRMDRSNTTLHYKAGLAKTFLNNSSEWIDDDRFSTDIDTPIYYGSSNIWTDGTDTYYSNEDVQYVFDHATSTWRTKKWNGLTSFSGSKVWSDGSNVYYNLGTSDCWVLDKSTYTWQTKTWTFSQSPGGLAVSRIWSDGTDIYYSEASKSYILNKTTSTWTIITWNNNIGIYGNYVWSDGENTYYTRTTDYVFNKTNKTWSTKTWNVSLSYGSNIWTDGENIYHSNSSKQYILDKTNLTWSTKTWNGLMSFSGEYVWNDGVNIHYAPPDNPASRYILDKETSTWIPEEIHLIAKAPDVILNTRDAIWSDGENIYYSDGRLQLRLNETSLVWEPKEWSGLTSAQLSNFQGKYVWTDGIDIYYSNADVQKVLNKETKAWVSKTWNGIVNFDGSYIWTDGTGIYYSYMTSNYVLDVATSTWSNKTWKGVSGLNLFGKYVWSDGNNIYYSSSSNQFVLDADTSTWIPKTWTGLTQPSGIYIWTDGENIYHSSSDGSTVYVLDPSIYTWTQVSFNYQAAFGKIWMFDGFIYCGLNKRLSNKFLKTSTTDRFRNLQNSIKKRNADLDIIGFEEASSRTNISSGENLSTLFGKIKKYFTDLKTVAFTGSYNDLIDKPYNPGVPTSIPIGTIISLMGNSAPENFLICNGQVVNIEDYSDLAAYFSVQFGRSNYFGGNGTTTFAVPDLRGEFLRGTGTNGHSYQGSGANVGVHQDATSIPRITVATSLSCYPQSGYTFDVTNEDYTTGSSVKNKYTSVTTGSTNNTSKYTTRPTNTAVLYCIAVKNL